jgi:predicted ATP-grasp superfamily ATP-dependent carboligase
MSHDRKIGAVVIGGEHPGLAIARSLGRRDIPVVVIDDQFFFFIFSIYLDLVIMIRDMKNE